MIKSFSCKETEKIFNGHHSKKIDHSIQLKALKKLIIINSSTSEIELNNPPGNRLEKLSGNLDEFHSIRINDQWRIIFIWKDNHAYGVQIIDYH